MPLFKEHSFFYMGRIFDNSGSIEPTGEIDFYLEPNSIQNLRPKEKEQVKHILKTILDEIDVKF